MEEFMGNSPHNVPSKTYTRVEHLDGGDGVRFSYIARYTEDDGANRHDPNWYCAAEKRPGFFRKLLDSLKGMLSRR
jgi:hypothetical protein